ncbi:MAG: hypothetical protein OCD01_02210 [Fibrobacterales bacterium]
MWIGRKFFYLVTGLLYLTSGGSQFIYKNVPGFIYSSVGLETQAKGIAMVLVGALMLFIVRPKIDDGDIVFLDVVLMVFPAFALEVIMHHMFS